ncbi:MAG TPA: DUF4326 domain-containing protein [Polyangiaceae bacterium]|nr:DUF4326 domain-containing protein [Polyangiaceae bacterium]
MLAAKRLQEVRRGPRASTLAFVTPVRIQRSRAKGSRLESPNGLPIVCVSRPSKWGNPFSEALASAPSKGKPAVRAASVRQFRQALRAHDPALGFGIQDVRRELRGKNLACWCPLDEPCHADVLLKVANSR